jgi:hypothetical protein
VSETYEQRAEQCLKAHIDAFENDPVARGQAALDRMWQERLDAAEEHRRMMQQLNEFGLKIW